ncbi:MAG: hypothetical protein H6736_24015 [Alphaproteobacteria bacterium]|nr:hypothetical protein [Alphaproteobacteria bacterium]MCB9694887.1 hypothetical protein [Alphaproteobacteria bacterium]
MLSLGVGLCLACGGMATTDARGPRGPGKDVEPASIVTEEVSVLHSVEIGGGTLRWVGEAPEGAPKTYGVERLELVLDGRVVPFRPKGELHFSDWSFDVVSPDGAWVVLLQDRTGPFHAVRSRRLATYLAGESEPDRVIGYEGPAEGFRPVLTGPRWTAPHTLHYTEASEAPEDRTVELGP